MKETQYYIFYMVSVQHGWVEKHEEDKGRLVVKNEFPWSSTKLSHMFIFFLFAKYIQRDFPSLRGHLQK